MTSRDEIVVRPVPVDQIEIGPRLHIFDKARVLSLSDDMEARGLMSPILLREMPNGVLRLVAGRHRLASAHLLGWETIAAIVEEMTDEEADCAEIEENQQRGSLTVLERGLGLARLKEIYLKLHPDTAKGKYDRGIKDNNDLYVFSASEALSGQRPARFTLEEAKKHGVDEKAIKRLVQIGEAVTSELKAEIAGTPLADNQAQLLKLVDLPLEDRAPIVRMMKERGVYKVAQAQQYLAGIEEEPPLPLEEAWQRKMAALWAGGKKAWQHRFLASIHAQYAPRDEGND